MSVKNIVTVGGKISNEGFVVSGGVYKFIHQFFNIIKKAVSEAFSNGIYGYTQDV
jgi:predicted butyrate kinase (DUF1464 family)